jgi:hypothetical protein
MLNMKIKLINLSCTQQINLNLDYHNKNSNQLVILKLKLRLKLQLLITDFCSSEVLQFYLHQSEALVYKTSLKN